MKTIEPLILTSKSERAPKPGDDRFLISGVKLTCISYGSGYVTAQQAACYPTIYPLRAWNQLLK